MPERKIKVLIVKELSPEDYAQWQRYMAMPTSTEKDAIFNDLYERQQRWRGTHAGPIS